MRELQIKETTELSIHIEPEEIKEIKDLILCFLNKKENNQK